MLSIFPRQWINSSKALCALSAGSAFCISGVNIAWIVFWSPALIAAISLSAVLVNRSACAANVTMPASTNAITLTSALQLPAGLSIPARHPSVNRSMHSARPFHDCRSTTSPLAPRSSLLPGAYQVYENRVNHETTKLRKARKGGTELWCRHLESHHTSPLSVSCLPNLSRFHDSESLVALNMGRTRSSPSVLTVCRGGCYTVIAALAVRRKRGHPCLRWSRACELRRS